MSSKNAQNIFIGFLFFVLLHNASALLVPENETIYLTFSPHDLSFELSSFAHLNVCISQLPPGENITIVVVADLGGVVSIQPPNITFYEPSQCRDVVLYGSDYPGHLTVEIQNYTDFPPEYDLTGAYCRLKVNVHNYLDVLDEVIGWIYFVAWIVSFWPQIWINFRRRSVVGLNLDFVCLNILGFTCYSMYNFGLYYIPEIQTEYLKRHEFGILPAKRQDIAFAGLALVSTIITGIQALIYERGGQKVSKPAIGIIGLALLFLLISLALALASVIEWLDYLYYFSYTKLAITLIKYIPQAYFNYRRKSTKGWSIGNILLDFTGGTFSMLQMFIDAFNYNDWSSLFGDFTKFALGLISILFDVVFMIQHYVLYRNKRPIYETMSENNPKMADVVRHSISESND